MALMKSVDLQLWERSLAVYKDIVSLLSDEKRKRKKGKVVEEDDLYNLDQWYIKCHTHTGISHSCTLKGIKMNYPAL